MNQNVFDYLVNMLEKNAGWRFTEDDFFVLDKKASMNDMDGFLFINGLKTISDGVKIC